jgi:hypothetical protein
LILRAFLLAIALTLCSGAQGAPPAKKNPAWSELSAEHQRILAPLKPEWDSLGPARKRKWLGIAQRYPEMTAQAQERVHKRMAKWASLTPEQRRQVRERYREIARKSAKTRKLREQWAKYQALPPEERSRLAPPPEPPPPEKKK